MILPASQAATLALLVISFVCWGSWANTLKLAGKWRFELYYYDFAIGFGLLALLAAFTGGSLNSAELTFQDNFLITGYRNIAYMMAAGVIFNLGTMLLTAALSIAGMALAFTIAFATALVVSTARNLLFEVPTGMLLSLSGSGLLLAALVLAAFAYSNYLDTQAAAARNVPLQVDPRTKSAQRAPRPPGAGRAVALAVVGGIALGLFRPMVDAGREGETGVAPYGAALLFAVGILGCTAILGPFFVNFPVAGGPLGMGDYFKGAAKQHVQGLIGGATAGIAFLSAALALAAPPFLRTTAMPGFALSQGGPVLAVAWGLYVWREFRGADEQTRLMLQFSLVLLAAGVALLAVARR